MKPSVLILSSPSDAHAVAVAKHLNELQIDPVFWSAKDFFQQTCLRFELGNEARKSSLRAVNGNTAKGVANDIDMNGFDAIWLRRPQQIESQELPEKWMEPFVAHESNRALESIYRITPGRWINSPEREANARFKIVQLEMAKQCGLLIPETLVTNDPDAAQNFCADHKQVIYKLIDERSGRLLPREPGAAIATTPVRESDLKHLAQVKHCLHLFQRRIAKRYDVRITVVEDKLFAAAIESQGGKGAVDFRLDFSVPMKIESLPAGVAEGCRRFMQKMGLVFGAIDMAFDVEGRYYFFEVNPAGQWLWIEEALDLPVSRELALVLARSDSN
jgi:glutathione synthase/RimK-type ligase-like ATP-grasp enzyme